MRCLGYDLDGQEFDCPNEAGTPWTKFWCLPCDERRRARITHQLEEIQRHFEESSGTADLPPLSKPANVVLDEQSRPPQ